MLFNSHKPNLDEEGGARFLRTLCRMRKGSGGRGGGREGYT